uniref:Uncharacterized protein n=1 Tax=Meloidogyne enterolobii TaxID=390850 RepID=A0A6V7XUX0_MELEN|nr:unnamed protein product [Meloidogyne enterolobii]
MSKPFRDQLILFQEQGLKILDNQKTFPLPPDNVSLSQFHSDTRKLLCSLEIELEYISKAISDISSTHDKWMAVRTNMTGAERTADTPIYENFVTNTPYLGTLFQLKKYLKNLRSSRQIIISALPDPNQPTESHWHLPEISLPKFSGNCQSTSIPNTYTPIHTNQISPLSPSSNMPTSPYQTYQPYTGFNPYFHHNMCTSPIPPQNLSSESSRTTQESEIENNSLANFCVQNTPFEPNPDSCTLKGIHVTDPPPTLTEDKIVLKVKQDSHLSIHISPQLHTNSGP